MAARGAVVYQQWLWHHGAVVWRRGYVCADYVDSKLSKHFSCRHDESHHSEPALLSRERCCILAVGLLATARCCYQYECRFLELRCLGAQSWPHLSDWRNEL